MKIAVGSARLQRRHFTLPRCRATLVDKDLWRFTKQMSDMVSCRAQATHRHLRWARTWRKTPLTRWQRGEFYLFFFSLECKLLLPLTHTPLYSAWKMRGASESIAESLRRESGASLALGNWLLKWRGAQCTTSSPAAKGEAETAVYPRRPQKFWRQASAE